MLKGLKKSMSTLNVLPAELPTWLTSDFFRNLLSISGDIKLNKVQHACAVGDNFASKIYRTELLHADGTTQWLIVKSKPSDGGFSEEFVTKFEIFPKEIEMYKFVDRFEGLFRALGCDIAFSPK